MPRCPVHPVLLLILVLACRPLLQGDPAPAAAAAQVQAVIEGYRAAWLRGDSAAVLRLFAPDAVLLPHHGDLPVVGRSAIAAFWWSPSAPTTTITTLEQTTEGMQVEGRTGVVWGRFTLAFSYQDEGRTHSLRNSGTYLMVLRRESDGEWRITHRMWDDPVAQPVDAGS